MSGTPAPFNLYVNLLQRDCDIAKAATWTNASGVTEAIANAFPRRFQPIVGPYPLVLCFVAAARYERSQRYVDHFMTVTIQVWGGPVAAGYQGEMEDRINYVYGALTYEFDRRPYLDSPTTGVPLEYLAPDDAAMLTDSPTGTTGFQVEDGQTVTRYFGAEFTQGVHLRVPRSRLS